VTKHHDACEIAPRLQLVLTLMAQGRTTAEAIRAIGVTEVTYYRWRRKFGGLDISQVQRLKELEAEIAKLRRAVSDLTLDKLILLEAVEEKLPGPGLRGIAVNQSREGLGISERRACRVLGQHRSTQRKSNGHG
jgi:putative transposase